MRGLAAAIALVLVAAGSSGCDSRSKNGPLTFERMRNQPRYNAYERSHFFADGMTMRPVPDGTVERSAREDDAVTTGFEGGALVTAIPVAIDRDAIRLGQVRYDQFCRPCHDVDGTGNTPVARNMQLRPPPSLLEARIRALSVGRLFTVVSHGYGLMPAYARQLAPEDRWAVIAYVRALQLRAGVPLDELPPALRQEAAAALGNGAGR